MKNIIDKDVNLFLPKKYNFLLLGGNFLLSKRLYEIAKRQFEIKRVDYDFNAEEEYFPCIESSGFDIYIEPAKKLETMIELYNSNVLIFTSEVFLFLNDSKFQEFLEVIKLIQQKNIKLIFISITNPIHICKNKNGNAELTNMSSKIWYSKRISDLEKILNYSKDLVFECSSYITYVKSNIQVNIIDLLKNNNDIIVNFSEKNSVLHIFQTDYLVNYLIKEIHQNGKKYFEKEHSESISLFDFSKKSIDSELFKTSKTQSECSVNLIYRKKPNESENNKSIANWRIDLGNMLADNIPENIKQELDIIVPIPETGKYYAQGLSQSLNKPYVEAFYKKFDIGRSFDIANSDKRKIFLDSKLGLLDDLVIGKVVGIVDEAIFTGQTLRVVKSLLEQYPVKKIYFFIASPICSSKCTFNMMPDRELLSNGKTLEEIRDYFGIEGIIFQDLSAFKNIAFSSGFTCTRCFN